MCLLRSPIGFFRHHVPMLRDAARMWERQVLLFPVLVVVLASTAFFFGGHCAPWQWWVSVAAMLAFPLAWGCRRTGLLSNCLFLGTLIFLWCLTPWMLDHADAPDCVRYHLPTIRLLALGWNPVSDPQAFEILERLHLDPVGQAWVSVAFLAKTAGIFNAVSSFFFQDPLAISFPIVCFLALAALFSAIRAADQHPWVGFLSFLVLILFATDVTYVDESLAIASGGLLFAMAASLRRGKLAPFQLGVFTFWLVNCKLSGCAAAMAFWSVFAVFFAKQHGRKQSTVAAKNAILGAIAIAAASCLVSFNPYGTSLRDFRHPLYPLKTVDPNRYPLMNIPADCKIGNEDWHRMGYWGTWFNSYTSPRLVRAWYNWRLKRTDFAPHQYIWDYSWKDTGKRFPVPFKTRFGIWISVLALLATSRWRPFALMMILGLSIFPKQYMGYLRYYPWLAAFEACALAAVLEWLTERKSWRPVFSGLVFLTAMLAICKPIVSAKFAAFIMKQRELSVGRPYVMTLYPGKWTVPENIPIEGKPLYPEGKAHMNNAILLLKALGKENTEVRFRPPGETEGLIKTKFGYYIDAVDADTIGTLVVSGDHSYGTTIFGQINRCLKTLFVEYPNILWNRLACRNSGTKTPLRIRAQTIVPLPDAIGSEPGTGFTCTGLAWDSVADTFWIGNIGKSHPEDPEFAPTLVHVSNNFKTNLEEIALSPVFPRMQDVQGVAINIKDGSFWIASCREGMIHHMTSDGVALDSFPVHRPSGIVHDSRDETLFILTDEEIIHARPDGVRLDAWQCNVSGQDQLFLDESDNVLYFSAGKDYNGNGFVYKVDLESGDTRCLFELPDSHAIEGIWIAAKDELFVLNDGYYHSAKIPVNQLNRYTIPPTSTGKHANQ